MVLFPFWTSEPQFQFRISDVEPWELRETGIAVPAEFQTGLRNYPVFRTTVRDLGVSKAAEISVFESVSLCP